MLFEILNLLSTIFHFALHLTGESFPKPLTLKEERECFEKISQGDDAARNRVIEHNLRLVAHIVKKYHASGIDQDDLISIGTIGLIKAVSGYSCKKETKFATYASRCIENEILMYFRSLKKTSQEVYISDPIDTDAEGNSLSLIDIVADERDIADDIELKLQSEKLYRYIVDCLTPRERTIIKLRYGLCSTAPLTQQEVANRLKISRSYVSRIEKKSLIKLKKRFEQ
ncbi:MAG: RNA polymerase sporulation sigma factor SigK [Oscillospiraceae bacterium]|nr:RNA polymerase sporulation sigma factor SigK [Oscillospiraceae bacterium]